MAVDDRTKNEIHHALRLLEVALVEQESKENIAKFLAGYMATIETYIASGTLPNGLKQYHETVKELLGISKAATPEAARPS